MYYLFVKNTPVPSALRICPVWCITVTFLMIYKPITTLMMNFLTCWQLLVNKTHHCWTKNSKNALNIIKTHEYFHAMWYVTGAARTWTSTAILDGRPCTRVRSKRLQELYTSPTSCLIDSKFSSENPALLHTAKQSLFCTRPAHKPEQILDYMAEQMIL